MRLFMATAKQILLPNSISLKETGESIYWLTLLKRTGIFEFNYDLLLSQTEEIKRMLIASINTAKSKEQ